MFTTHLSKVRISLLFAFSLAQVACSSSEPEIDSNDDYQCAGVFEAAWQIAVSQKKETTAGARKVLSYRQAAQDKIMEAGEDTSVRLERLLEVEKLFDGDAKNKSQRLKILYEDCAERFNKYI